MARITTFAIFLALALQLLASGSVSAQDPIQILDIDTYARTIAPGTSTAFNWTLRNLDSIAYDVRVRTSAPGGWQAFASPAFIANLSANRAAPVSVAVTAPASVLDQTVAQVSVTFTVYQDAAVIFVATRTAFLTIPSIFAEKRVLGLFSNPLPAPLDNEWGVFILDVGVWLFLSGGILLIAMPVVSKVSDRSRRRFAHVFLRTIRVPLIVLLTLYGTLQSLGALDRYVDTRVRSLLLEIYQVGLILVLVYLAVRLFRDVVIHYARSIAKKTQSKMDDIIIPVAEKIGLAIIALAGLGLLLGYLHLDLTLFIAGGVVTSMVIAFAAQDTLSNFFSGIFLLADRPFREGDVVILSDGDWGEVRKIGVRTTRLFRFSDAALLTIPNNKLVNEKVANFSNPQDRGRLMMTFGAGYGADIAKVKRIVRDVIRGNEHIFQEAPYEPIVRFDALGESALQFFVLVWLDSRDHRFEVKDYLNTEVYSRFRDEGIEIPFPMRTVHLRIADPGRQTLPLEIHPVSSDSPSGDHGSEDGEDSASRKQP